MEHFAQEEQVKSFFIKTNKSKCMGNRTEKGREQVV